MTDGERIESLGFVRSPHCPLRMMPPATMVHVSERARWDALINHKVQMEGIGILNQCLSELIHERFFRQFGRDPMCSLTPFLFATEETVATKKY